MARHLAGGLRALALAALVLVPAACARPIGDFGRADNSVLHDEVLPILGRERAELTGEPVSRFNLTDEEREMHDRLWRFLVAPHAGDWFMDTAVELQRTRLTNATDHRFDPARYYRWLTETHYQSSRIRYKTVADDARADLDTLPETFRIICAVIEIDRRRAAASDGLGGLERGEVRDRHFENTERIGWFVRALSWRYEAYAYALDHLLVETPHEEARDVDTRLSDLAIWVEQAERGDFCSGGPPGYADGDVAIPSRILKGDGKSYRK